MLRQSHISAFGLNEGGGGRSYRERHRRKRERFERKGKEGREASVFGLQGTAMGSAAGMWLSAIRSGVLQEFWTTPQSGIPETAFGNKTVLGEGTATKGQNGEKEKTGVRRELFECVSRESANWGNVILFYLFSVFFAFSFIFV